MDTSFVQTFVKFPPRKSQGEFLLFIQRNLLHWFIHPLSLKFFAQSKGGLNIQSRASCRIDFSAAIRKSLWPCCAYHPRPLNHLSEVNVRNSCPWIGYGYTLLKNLGIKSKGYIAYNFHVFSQSRVFRQTESSDINFPLPTIGKRST